MIETDIQQLLLYKISLKIPQKEKFTSEKNIVYTLLNQIILLAKHHETSEDTKKENHIFYNNSIASWPFSLEHVHHIFEVEIDAYHFYLTHRKHSSESELLEKVSNILYDEYEVLENKIHDIIDDSLRIKFNKKETTPIHYKTQCAKNILLDHIKTLAICHDMAYAIHITDTEIKASKKYNIPTTDDISKELRYIQSIAQEEIKAYKNAIQAYKNKIPFDKIISTLKSELNLETVNKNGLLSFG